MIQDILPYEYDNHYENAEPTENDGLVFIGENSFLAKESDGEIQFPKMGEVSAFGMETTYLFSISGRRFFYAVGDKQEAALLKEGYEFCPLSFRRSFKPQWLYFAAETAYQIGSWYRSNQYCGHCGSPLKKDSKERMLHCDNCGNSVYPKICPAVIVAVTNGDSVLVTRYAGSTFKRYALIAGFAEVGESIEETVRREVMEETGVRVKNIRYYKSQPWSFTDTLLFGFYCELDGSAEITMDRNELSLAEWVTRADLPPEGEKISLTSEMIEKFRIGEQR